MWQEFSRGVFEGVFWGVAETWRMLGRSMAGHGNICDGNANGDVCGGGRSNIAGSGRSGGSGISSAAVAMVLSLTMIIGYL